MAQTDELISTGELAARLGRAPSTIKFLEARGVITPSIRVIGSNRRVWPSAQTETIRAQLNAHRGARSKATA